MPGIEDWRFSPLQQVQRSFEAELEARKTGKSPSKWQKSVYQFIRNKLESCPDFRTQIPDLNACDNHELMDGQLVRFRCMIQDMFDPEFFPAEYDVKNLGSGQVRTASGRFRDFADKCSREEIVDGTSKDDQRLMYYCISVPAEAPWVTQNYDKVSPRPAIASGSNSNMQQRKRRWNDEENSNSAANNAAAAAEQQEDMDVGGGGESVSGEKKSKGSAGNESAKATSSGLSLNLPIPNAKGHAAIVKIYDTEDGEFRLNQVVEFVGIISLNPLLAQIPIEMGVGEFSQFDLKEMRTKNPPASLIPRLHVMAHFKLPHSNPLLPLQVDLSNKAAIKAEATKCRADLHAMLTCAFLGDTLAADYMICHLVARIYHRTDVLSLGKFSLNLFRIPTTNNYSRRLATLLRLLMTKSHRFDLSVKDLNKAAVLPRKDHEVNRLVAGLLQLSDNTHLILDETDMEEGRLTAEGLKNVTSFGHLIKYQKLAYDFIYHTVDFETDIQCLVLSEGRSMFPHDSQLMMDTHPEAAMNIDREFEVISGRLSEEFLNRIRKYLTMVRLLDFDLHEDVQRAIQEHFVNERRAQRMPMTTDDLHAHLVLARLIGTSKGETSLTDAVWEQTKTMEKARRERMADLVQREQHL